MRRMRDGLCSGIGELRCLPMDLRMVVGIPLTEAYPSTSEGPRGYDPHRGIPLHLWGPKGYAPQGDIPIHLF